nr:arginine metabolism regulation protein ii [Quercus suber]
MPRPKKESGVEPKKRSRTGCWPCKARKIKCGEEHPACANCVKSGETCDYSIRLNWGGRSRKDKDGTPTEPGSLTFVNPPTPGDGPQHADHGHEHVFSAQHIATAPAMRSSNGHRSNMSTPEPGLAAEGAALDPRLRVNNDSASPAQFLASRFTAQSAQFPPSSLWSATGKSFPTSAPVADDFTWSSQHSAKRVRLHSPPDSQSTPVFTASQYFSDTSPASTSYTSHSIGSVVNTPVTPGSTIGSGSPFPPQAASLQVQETPDLRRLSVKSLLSDPLADETERPLYHKTGSSRYYTYGYDHGLPDLDVPRNNDMNVVLPRSPDMRRVSAAGSDVSTFSSSTDARQIVFEAGGYYAQPVAVRIPRFLEPLPAELRENQMNLLYFHHFINHTGRIMVPHDCPENPLRGVLPQMAVRNTHLLHLVLAFSASHRARLLDHPEPANRIAAWMSDVVPALRLALVEGQSPAVVDPTDPSNLAPLATAIMLASLEIVSPDTFSVAIPWQSHLNFARQLIIAKGGLHHLAQRADGARDKAIFFLSRWFAYLDVLGALSGGRQAEPLHGAYEEDGGGEWLVNRSDDEIFQIDCFFGFSGRCIALLAQVAELASRCDKQRIDPITNQIKAGWAPDMETRTHAERLRNALEASARCVYRGSTHKSPYDSPSETRNERDAAEIFATNEAYHWAGLVHLSRRVLGLPSRHPEVQVQVQRVISSLEKVRRGSSAESCLLFPMFSAGCEAQTETDRELFMDRLRAVEGWDHRDCELAEDVDLHTERLFCVAIGGTMTARVDTLALRPQQKRQLSTSSTSRTRLAPLGSLSCRQSCSLLHRRPDMLGVRHLPRQASSDGALSAGTRFHASILMSSSSACSRLNLSLYSLTLAHGSDLEPYDDVRRCTSSVAANMNLQVRLLPPAQPRLASSHVAPQSQPIRASFVIPAAADQTFGAFLRTVQERVLSKSPGEIHELPRITGLQDGNHADLDLKTLVGDVYRAGAARGQRVIFAVQGAMEKEKGRKRSREELEGRGRREGKRRKGNGMVDSALMDAIESVELLDRNGSKGSEIRRRLERPRVGRVGREEVLVPDSQGSLPTPRSVASAYEAPVSAQKLIATQVPASYRQDEGRAHPSPGKVMRERSYEEDDEMEDGTEMQDGDGDRMTLGQDSVVRRRSQDSVLRATQGSAKPRTRDKARAGKGRISGGSGVKAPRTSTITNNTWTAAEDALLLKAVRERLSVKEMLEKYKMPRTTTAARSRRLILERQYPDGTIPLGSGAPGEADVLPQFPQMDQQRASPLSGRLDEDEDFKQALAAGYDANEIGALYYPHRTQDELEEKFAQLLPIVLQIERDKEDWPQDKLSISGWRGEQDLQLRRCLREKLSTRDTYKRYFFDWKFTSVRPKIVAYKEQMLGAEYDQTEFDDTSITVSSARRPVIPGSTSKPLLPKNKKAPTTHTLLSREEAEHSRDRVLSNPRTYVDSHSPSSTSASSVAKATISKKRSEGQVPGSTSLPPRDEADQRSNSGGLFTTPGTTPEPDERQLARNARKQAMSIGRHKALEVLRRKQTVRAQQHGGETSSREQTVTSLRPSKESPDRSDHEQHRAAMPVGSRDPDENEVTVADADAVSGDSAGGALKGEVHSVRQHRDSSDLNTAVNEEPGNTTYASDNESADSSAWQQQASAQLLGFSSSSPEVLDPGRSPMTATESVHQRRQSSSHVRTHFNLRPDSRPSSQLARELELSSIDCSANSPQKHSLVKLPASETRADGQLRRKQTVRAQQHGGEASSREQTVTSLRPSKESPDRSDHEQHRAAMPVGSRDPDENEVTVADADAVSGDSAGGALKGEVHSVRQHRDSSDLNTAVNEEPGNTTYASDNESADSSAWQQQASAQLLGFSSSSPEVLDPGRSPMTATESVHQRRQSSSHVRTHFNLRPDSRPSSQLARELELSSIDCSANSPQKHSLVKLPASETRADGQKQVTPLSKSEDDENALDLASPESSTDASFASRKDTQREDQRAIETTPEFMTQISTPRQSRRLRKYVSKSPRTPATARTIPISLNVKDSMPVVEEAKSTASNGPMVNEANSNIVESHDPVSDIPAPAKGKLPQRANRNTHVFDALRRRNIAMDIRSSTGMVASHHSSENWREQSNPLEAQQDLVSSIHPASKDDLQSALPSGRTVTSFHDIETRKIEGRSSDASNNVHEYRKKASESTPSNTSSRQSSPLIDGVLKDAMEFAVQSSEQPSTTSFSTENVGDIESTRAIQPIREATEESAEEEIARRSQNSSDEEDFSDVTDSDIAGVDYASPTPDQDEDVIHDREVVEVDVQDGLSDDAPSPSVVDFAGTNQAEIDTVANNVPEQLNRPWSELPGEDPLMFTRETDDGESDTMVYAEDLLQGLPLYDNGFKEEGATLKYAGQDLQDDTALRISASLEPEPVKVAWHKDTDAAPTKIPKTQSSADSQDESSAQPDNAGQEDALPDSQHVDFPAEKVAQSFKRDAGDAGSQAAVSEDGGPPVSDSASSDESSMQTDSDESSDDSSSDDDTEQDEVPEKAELPGRINNSTGGQGHLGEQSNADLAAKTAIVSTQPKDTPSHLNQVELLNSRDRELGRSKSPSNPRMQKLARNDHSIPLTALNPISPQTSRPVKVPGTTVPASTAPVTSSNRADLRASLRTNLPKSSPMMKPTNKTPQQHFKLSSLIGKATSIPASSPRLHRGQPVKRSLPNLSDDDDDDEADDDSDGTSSSSV